MSKGSVTFVGAGPGDPGLLTRHGQSAIEAAQVVVFDHLVDPRIVALSPPGALRIYAGKRSGCCALPQDAINQILLEHAQAGRRVVRLKGGDPFVFGRGGEEAAHLAEFGVPFRVVPGVTAAVGVAAYAGIPLTHRADSSAVALVTGHDDPGSGRLDWAALAAFPGTLVVYMGLTRLGAYCEALVRHGKSAETPAAIVESGTSIGQRTVVGTLGSLETLTRQAGVKPPALVLIGDVVARRKGLDWFERLPLAGQTVLVTRPKADDDAASTTLEALGAEVLHAPMVLILPVQDPAALDRAIDAISRFDWLVFTSSNGVKHFLARLLERGSDMRALGRTRLAAIGPSTAETLASYHLRADLVPGQFRSEALAAELRDLAKGQRVLLARADRGRDLLRSELEQVAAFVEHVAVYRNVDAPGLPREVLDRLDAGRVDWVTLTSSASAERLHALLPAHLRSRLGGLIRIASISPVTTETAVHLGWHVAAEAEDHSWPGLVRAILAATAKPA